jgi:hypothetical protein
MATTTTRYPAHVSVYEEPVELGALKNTYTLEDTDFETSQKTRNVGNSSTANPYIIIGFDTEYQTPNYHVSKQDIKSGLAKYKVLSYQFHAKLSTGLEWQGICCTENDERLTMSDLIVFALGKGKTELNLTNIPTQIFLVGHFTRADIPAFSDFKSLQQFMSSVRNTFLSIDQYHKILLENNSNIIAELKVLIRDTMLLTPQSSRSLKNIGKLVGLDKLQLDDDINIHKYMISNMEKTRTNNWEKYKKYALADASICTKYIEKIIDQYESVTGKKKVPATLTSIGVDLLLKTWSQKLNLDPVKVLGKETVTHKFFDKKRNYFRTKKEQVDIYALHRNLALFTECYHGGRGEQFWFGPAFEDDWIDIDLASAYPTAMSLIGLPDWDQLHTSNNIEDYQPTTLGFAKIEFEFPEHTRYPTMPVRTNNGLVFPLKGTSYCSAPEIVVAKNLGCKLKIVDGIIIPTNNEIRIFGEFIKECIQKRMAAGSKSFEGLFWKEISNSTYGKTAQGLHKKRVYDMRDQTTKPLPPSKITNPCFASYITSFVRALLGEIMNSIHEDKVVFSCTTDGFLTNTPESEIPHLSSGQLAQLYSNARQLISSDSKILEIKHAIRQPLGWRTRGQATLKVHDHLKDQDCGIVLAKGGIFTKPESEELEQQNQEIIDMFFNRKPDSMIYVISRTGIRDMIEHDADLVDKEIHKHLNMEYDWKRQPFNIETSTEYNHVYFTTRPWLTVEQFERIRDLWDEYTKSDKKCIKNLDDFNLFSEYVECRSISNPSTKYLSKTNPDIKRLRQLLCSAWQSQNCGLSKSLIKTANDFATLLTQNGIPCTRANVENGRKRPFEPHTCPPTPTSKKILLDLKQHIPSLKVDMFLYEFSGRDAVTIRPNQKSSLLQ